MTDPPAASRDSLLHVEDLRTRFHTDAGTVTAVDGISFDLDDGETVCLVGESGSGKTVAAESLTRLIDDPPGEIVSGTVRFDDRDLATASEAELRAVRGDRIAHVFQNPQRALNPVYSVGWQLLEAIQLHDDVSKADARARAIDLLDRVGIPDPATRIDDYPHELSGGMQQRVAIAMALAGEPDLLVADEPTTALDVTIQSQVLRLLESIQSASGLGLLLVTHDLGVVAEVADRVVVMYDGTVMERGSVHDIFERPSHPYTRALLDAIPGRDVDLTPTAARDVADRDPSSATDSTTGCRFRSRCPHAVDACREGDQPPLHPTPDATTSAPDGARAHVAACVHFGPDGDPDVVVDSANSADSGASADESAGGDRR
jgi:peptide/nickel transport system ATP-binding protein